jgi:hypothetical protein
VVTDDRFDELTRRMAATASRRAVLKGVMATALGGVALRLRGGSNDAEARARVRMACARLGQACATGVGTPGNMVCCPDLTCGADSVCCKDTNDTCVADADCCADTDVCRPNPSGIGNRCLPPGELGAKCQEDADCAGTLVCDLATDTCLVVQGEPCVDDADCVSGLCDEYTGMCIGGCLVDGSGCAESTDCCSGFCDPYTLSCVAAAADGAPCSVPEQCASGTCGCQGICETPVSPGNLGSWTPSISGTTQSVTFVTGPGVPPLCAGSVQLSVGSEGAEAAQLRSTAFNGVLLSDIDTLSYATYVQQYFDSQAPYLILNIDQDGNGTNDDLLFFEPVSQTAAFIEPGMPAQPTIALNTWQQWDARDGCWWSLNGGAGLGPGTNCNSLDVYITAFPNAVIQDTPSGGLRVVAGFGAGAWDNFIGNVDDLEITVAGATSVFDFEPTP